MAEDYRTLRDQRVAQFAKRLKAISDYRDAEGRGDSFVRFSESREDEFSDAPLTQKEVWLFICKSLDATSEGDSSIANEITDESDAWWRPDSNARKYVQFAFCSRYFYMDLPRSTLATHEAARILKELSGFFYMADSPSAPIYNKEAARRYNPLCKIYISGDTEAAAQDMAHVIFGVWHFPIDWEFFITVGFFAGKPHLEFDQPMEGKAQP